MKSERNVLPKFFKSGLNKKIGHVNKEIQSEELEINNERTMCADKDKETLSAYDIKGNEKTLITYERKEKAWGNYDHIYECGKLL